MAVISVGHSPARKLLDGHKLGISDRATTLHLFVPISAHFHNVILFYLRVIHYQDCFLADSMCDIGGASLNTKL